MDPYEDLEADAEAQRIEMYTCWDQGMYTGTGPGDEGCYDEPDYDEPDYDEPDYDDDPEHHGWDGEYY